MTKRTKTLCTRVWYHLDQDSGFGMRYCAQSLSHCDLISGHSAPMPYSLCVFQDDVEEGCYMLLNQLMLLRPPAFIYAALPSHPASGRSVHTRKRLMGAGGAGAMADDDDECAVYGCYSAVMTSDCRYVYCGQCCSWNAFGNNVVHGMHFFVCKELHCACFMVC